MAEIQLQIGKLGRFTDRSREGRAWLVANRQRGRQWDVDQEGRTRLESPPLSVRAARGCRGCKGGSRCRRPQRLATVVRIVLVRTDRIDGNAVVTMNVPKRPSIEWVERNALQQILMDFVQIHRPAIGLQTVDFNRQGNGGASLCSVDVSSR